MTLRILLITPRFYGVEKKIKLILEESHYEVVWIENKTLTFDYHGTKSKLKLLRKVYSFFACPRERYLKNELKSINNLRFDILLSINAHVICPYLLRRLKSISPGLTSILYLWDSFSRYNWIDELKLFNKVYTFDRADAGKYQLIYKPNFYIKNNNILSSGTKHDLMFVGKFNPERIALIDRILNLSSSAGILCYVKLWPAYKILFHNYLVYNILRKFKISIAWVKNFLLNFEAVEGVLKREYFLSESLNYDKIQSHSLQSNVILDIPFGDQVGYTHRIIEALANGKKIITTNSQIRKETFFDPEQIHIIENHDPVLDSAWIKARSVFKIDSYFLNLELSEWLKTLINAEIA
jgi:hypothetical protein